MCVSRVTVTVARGKLILPSETALPFLHVSVSVSAVGIHPTGRGEARPTRGAKAEPEHLKC